MGSILNSRENSIMEFPKGQEKPGLSWNLYSFGFLALLLLFTFLGWQTYPHFVDIFHYLLTGWGYSQGGGYFASSFWDYAPVGRPNLYPPFTSFLIWGSSAILPSRILAVRLLSATTPLLFLISCWWVVKSIFNQRVSFWSLLLIGAAPSFYSSLSNNLAASWAIIFGLFSFLYYTRRNFVRATILLSLCCFSHTLVFALFFSSLCGYGLHKKHFKQTSMLFLVTLVLVSPLLLHQIRHMESFQSAFPGENIYLQIKPLIYILALWGVVISRRRKGPAYLILFLNFFSLLMIPSYVYRYVSSQGLFFVIILAALGWDDLYEKLANKIRSASNPGFLKPATLLLSLTLLLTSPLLSTSEKAVRFHLFNSVWSNYIGKWPASIYEKSFIKEEFLELAEEVKAHTGEKQIIYSNLNIAGVILASLSGRATANALAQEIEPYQRFDPLKKSRLIIWFKPEENDPHEYLRLNLILKRYGLLLVKDTPLAYLLLNPEATENIDIPSPTLNGLHLMLLVILLAAVWIGSGHSKVIKISRDRARDILK